MKAIFFEGHGDWSVLKYADLPDPTPAPGEAIIKVKAVALNHLDIWVRRGWKGLKLDLPHIPGSDIVGEVVSFSGNSKIPIGTRVMVNPGYVTATDELTRRGLDSLSPHYRIIGEHCRGGMAEFVSVPIENLFASPAQRTDEQLAASLLTGVTCYRMLFKQGDLRPNQSVLVVGSGGGVNSLAIQMATAAGAKVYAIASDSKKSKKALKLGAVECIDRSQESNWAGSIIKRTNGRGVDLVVDNVGHDTMASSLRAVARGGRIVTVGNTSGYELHLDNRLIFTKQVSLIGSTMGSTQDFIDSQEFMLRHNIIPSIDRVEPLSKGIEMFKYLEKGKQFGKIVLKPELDLKS